MIKKAAYLVFCSIIGCMAVFPSHAKLPTVLLVFNGDHDREAENLLASIKKNANELLPLITVCVSDDKSRAFANKHNLRFFEMSTITKTGTYMTHDMNIMTKRKFEGIVQLLQLKEDILYVDTDIVFLANPLADIKTNFDLNIQSDECFRPYKHANLCTGIMYINSNRHTIKFFKRAIAEIIASDYKIADQDALNMLIKNNKDFLRVNVLDVCKFPNGCRYFENTDKTCSKSDALMVHNNYLIGVDMKMRRFTDYGLIF